MRYALGLTLGRCSTNRPREQRTTKCCVVQKKLCVFDPSSMCLLVQRLVAIDLQHGHRCGTHSCCGFTQKATMIMSSLEPPPQGTLFFVDVLRLAQTSPSGTLSNKGPTCFGQLGLCFQPNRADLKVKGTRNTRHRTSVDAGSRTWFDEPGERLHVIHGHVVLTTNRSGTDHQVVHTCNRKRLQF